MMASCPPDLKVEETVPFGHGMQHIPEGGREVNQKTWDLSKANLASLFDLSLRIDLDGEVTPIMAWGTIIGHPRLVELSKEDIERVRDELLPKIRCYG